MSAAASLEGGCLCSRVRYQIDGIPEHVGHCHCESCRKATGAAFATFMWVETDQLTWLGEAPKSFRSSEIARRGFCRTCGTAIYFQYDAERDKGWDIHVGSLDNPGAVTPKSHVWYPKHDKNSPESDIQL